MLKQWQNILHMIVNVNLIAQHVILIKNEIIKDVNVNEEIIVKTKIFSTLSPSTCICEKSKYPKSIADTSVIACDEIIDVTDIVSTNMTQNKFWW